MFAIVLDYHSSSPQERTLEDPQYVDFGPFEFFECEGQSSPAEEAMFKLIQDLLRGSTDYRKVPSWLTEGLVTIDSYRKFYAMIQRNAQDVHPITDFHVHLASLAPSQLVAVTTLSNLCGTPTDDINHLLQSSAFLRNLQPLSATSMLQLGNCMNHSCSPNVVAACGHPDSRIQFIACSPIQKGDELCRSYIDESLSQGERRNMLLRDYGFLCSCPSCVPC